MARRRTAGSSGPAFFFCAEVVSFVGIMITPSVVFHLLLAHLEPLSLHADVLWRRLLPLFECLWINDQNSTWSSVQSCSCFIVLICCRSSTIYFAEGAVINNQAVAIHSNSCQRTSFLHSPSLILLSSASPTNPWPIGERRKQWTERRRPIDGAMPACGHVTSL
jgi:hypothetical protein